MKKITTLLLLSVTLVITSFTTNSKTETSGVRYAFITDTERDKTLDEDSKNGYVSITTNIVSIECTIRNQCHRKPIHKTLHCRRKNYNT